MSTQDLISEAFTLLNAYKRHRALADIKQTREEKNFHDLMKYKKIDELELALRGIQKEIRNQGNQLTATGEDKSDD